MNTQFYQTRSQRSVESLHIAPDNAFAGNSPRSSNTKAAAQAEKIERYARVSHHVLLTGERGTGKTTIARQIHDKGGRRKKQFVSLNCATLKEELVEAELFGYEKGAFTGANQAKAGLFEVGSGGTVFLDEVGELSLSLQAKLLKAVEEKRIRRVGASGEIPVDLRIIAATSRNLREMTACGEFRADLYDRLNVLSLDTIPLREQKEKIRALVVSGLERERVALGRRDNFQIEPLAFALLEDYCWTGNFRELGNFVLKMAIEHADAEIITKSDIRAMLAEKGATFDEAETGGENLPVSGHLILAINPDERLDRIIEQVKESYIRHHLKEKSLRGTSKQCGLSRKLVRRINSKLAEADNFGQQL
ncbi:MAG TPA: sigma 54-interacting transcriptional regulator [Pyrinomonadaceae bacterium]|nr:sigma 54-interacting transcriptional regulator [Pyrinomonadaceae bacterium]